MSKIVRWAGQTYKQYFRTQIQWILLFHQPFIVSDWNYPLYRWICLGYLEIAISGSFFHIDSLPRMVTEILFLCVLCSSFSSPFFSDGMGEFYCTGLHQSPLVGCDKWIMLDCSTWKSMFWAVFHHISFLPRGSRMLFPTICIRPI